MRRRFLSGIIVLVLPGLLTGISPAGAQETPPAARPQHQESAQAPQTLPLKQALAYALQANQEARKARLDIEGGQYKIDEAKAGALPKINASGGLTYNPILQLSALPGEFLGQPGEILLVPFGQKWGGNAGVSMSQTLYDQSVLTGLKAAKSTREFYALNAQLTEEQLIEQVATNYYQVLIRRQKLDVLDSTIRNAAKVLEIIDNQHQNGLARKIDVDRMKVNISNLQSQRQQLTNAVSLLSNQLKYAMGMPVETPIVLPPIALDDIKLEEWAGGDNTDFSGRSEFRIMQQQEQLLQLQKSAYKAGFYPNLSLTGNYSYQGLGNTLPVFKGPSRGVYWFDVASIGLNLKIPIFNGNAIRSKVRQADVEIRKVQEDIQKTEIGLRLAYENARTQIRNSLIVLDNQKENVRLAEEVFHNTRNNYNNGLATLTDLLDAENSFTAAQNNYATALLDFKVAEIQLIKSQGQLKTLTN